MNPENPYGDDSPLAGPEAQRYTRALDLARMGVWEWRPGTDRVVWSPQVEALWGYPEGTFAGTLEEVAARIHPEDRPAWQESIRACVEAGGEHRLEFRVVLPDDRVRWVQAVGDAERDGEGRVSRVLGVVLDVTDQVQARSETQRFFSLNLHLLMVTGLDGVIRRVNPAWQEVLGYPPERLAGMPYLDLVHPEDREATAAEAGRLAQGREIVRFENRYLTADGGHRHLLWAGTIAPESSLVFGAAVDVSEQRRAEAELRDSERRLREAEHLARIGHWELDLVTDRLLWSDQVFRIFELDPDGFEASYEAFLALVHPDDRELVDAAYQGSLDRREPYTVEHRLRMPDRRVKWVLERGETSFDPAGRPLRTLGTVQEITERKRAELEQERIRRLYATLSETNQAVVRVADPDELFATVCRVAVDYGELALAWVAEGAGGSHSRIRAIHGDNPYRRTLEGAGLGGAPEQELLGCLEGEPRVLNHIDEHTGAAPRWAFLRSAGVRAAAAFPLRRGGAVCGALAVYARERDYFQDKELRLLLEMAGDISFALDKLDQAAALRASEAKYRLLVEHQNDLVVKVDPEGRFQFVSPSYCRTFGKSEADLLGRRFMPLVHAEDQARTAAAMAELQRPPHSVYLEQRALTAEGWRWFGWSDRAVLDDQGRVTGVVGVGRDITRRKEAEAALAESEERYRELVDNMSDGVALYEVVDDGRDFVFRDINRAGLRIGGGLERKAVIGRPVQEVFPGVVSMGLFEVFQRVWASGEPEHHPLSVYHDGRLDLWTENYVYRLPSGYLVAIYTDQTEHHRAQQELQVAAVAFDAQEGIVITDAEARIRRVNQAFTRITGYAPEEVEGRNPRLLQSGRHDGAFFEDMWRRILEQGYWEGELWNRRKGGELYPQWLTISAVRDEHGRVSHYVGNFMDITERKRAEDRIHELAFYDPLTGLANRRLLQERLGHAMDSGARHREVGAVLMLDLDHFKNLNDTRGHDAGDALLVEVGQRLSASVRQSDTVARPGGDEFVLVLESLGRDLAVATQEAGMVADKVQGLFRETFDLEKAKGFRASASIGVTLYRGRDHSVEEVLKQADVALYEAKRAGRNTVRFFNADMQHAVEVHAEMESALHGALEHGELTLHYQPQVARGGELIGLEALLRWTPPDGQPVSPGVFIPVAEETGLIVPVGRWVLESACAQLRRWQGRPATADLVVSVNVSAKQFLQPGFVSDVVAALEGSGVRPSGLCLELTESVVVEDLDEVVARIESLKERGVRFSMDDFGTGYSSLSYLKRLPLDEVKIDTSFVQDIAHDPNDAAIVRTILAMGHSLQIMVIAEGVENEAQHAFLEENGCDGYQGYLFARPMAVGDFEAWLEERVARN